MRLVVTHVGSGAAVGPDRDWNSAVGHVAQDTKQKGPVAPRGWRMRGSHPVKGALLLLTALVIGMIGLGCQSEGYYGYPGERRGAGPQFVPKPGAASGQPTIVQVQYQPLPQMQAQPMPGPGMPPQDVRVVPYEYGNEPAPPPEAVPDRPRLPMPRELELTYHPAYVIEPPDVLAIDAVRLVPRPPYRIEPLDILFLQVAGTLPDRPILGQVVVSPDGTISLGYNYGVVRVAGLTLEAAAVVIRQSLMNRPDGLRDPQVSLALGQFRGIQQTRGDHLVNMDGTITLGSYGSVCVAGLTLCQAKAAIERHLAKFLLNPEISLNVSAFNSKYYYVIADGGGYGMQVLRFAITGKETVLDAISNISGLPAVSSTKKIWVARPTPAKAGCYQILPVNWQVLTMAGDTETNYQLFPGDRVYIKADPLIHLNNAMAKVFAPIEQVLGMTLLGATTAETIQATVQGNGVGFVGAGFVR